MGRARAHEGASAGTSANVSKDMCRNTPESLADRSTLLAQTLNEFKTRGTLVTGEGNPGAELVFISEGPGERDASNELLGKMIVAMGLSSESVYLLNVIQSDSAAVDLDRLLGILQPKVVVALGQFAAQALLATDAPISELRGKFSVGPHGIRIMPTLHPADLLCNPGSKREAWSDLQAVTRELGLALPPKAR